MKHRTHITKTICLLAASLTLAGCSKNKNEAAAPTAAAAPGAVEDSANAPDPKWDDPRPANQPIALTLVVLDPSLTDACGMTAAGDMVFFEYDSAELSDDAQDKLSRVATCLQGDTLEGRDLLVVGSASPPGDDDYNEELSEERASAVKTALVQGGVAENRLMVKGRGEVPDLPESSPDDDERLPISRRVDLVLIQ